jgi:hypothetical protein
MLSLLIAHFSMVVKPVVTLLIIIKIKLFLTNKSEKTKPFLTVAGKVISHQGYFTGVGGGWGGEQVVVAHPSDRKKHGLLFSFVSCFRLRDDLHDTDLGRPLHGPRAGRPGPRPCGDRQHVGPPSAALTGGQRADALHCRHTAGGAAHRQHCAAGSAPSCSQVYLLGYTRREIITVRGQSYVSHLPKY